MPPSFNLPANIRESLRSPFSSTPIELAAYVLTDEIIVSEKTDGGAEVLKTLLEEARNCDREDELVQLLKYLITNPCSVDSSVFKLISTLIDLQGDENTKLSSRNIIGIQQEYYAAQAKLYEENNGGGRNDFLDKGVKSVIRVNNIPFFESTYLQLMKEKAIGRGVNIRLVDVPWGCVGQALETGLIDAAIYNDNLLKQTQIPVHDTYSFEFYEYIGHVLMARVDCELQSYREAIVPDSDAGETIGDFIRARNEKVIVVPDSEFYELAKKCLILGEESLIPIASADEGIVRFLDGEYDYCLMGGLHARYVEEWFSDRVKNIGSLSWRNEGDSSEFTGPRNKGKIWLPHSPHVDALITELSEVWNETVLEWNSLQSSEDDSDQKHSLVRKLNGASMMAFVRDFGDMVALSKTHNKLQNTLKLLPGGMYESN